MSNTGLTILEGKNAPSLAKRTTLRLGGPALAEIILETPERACELPDIASRLGGKLVCLGAGSNILAADRELPLVLVKNAVDDDVAFISGDRAGCVMRVSSGMKLPALLARLNALDLEGLEGLSGIPGTVGGAVAMNAGSFGSCIADALVAAQVVTQTGEVRFFPKEAIDFGYRHMGIQEKGFAQNWFMVLSADFALKRAEQGKVAALSLEYMARKKALQPIHAASAGCVFKNPAAGASAGKLLEEAGWKGKRKSNMGFSSLHANFLINYGGGSSIDALELINEAKQAVLASSGVALETEVKLWL
ncbi:UDP-N-acetylenolpyruvoylglucosamine reductase [Deltaproteobacteria bacterium]|nr:UDP-N-acetylenolpyruvoylglucosamine reductase [Deltaproteobacteria bacterium]